MSTTTLLMLGVLGVVGVVAYSTYSKQQAAGDAALQAIPAYHQGIVDQLAQESSSNSFIEDLPIVGDAFSALEGFFK